MLLSPAIVPGHQCMRSSFPKQALSYCRLWIRETVLFGPWCIQAGNHAV